jgi:uncharacterized linocin/CFP29 family protein
LNYSNEVNWDQAIWQEINEAVVKEVAKVRTAQKVFPTTVLDNDPTEVQNDVIVLADLSIEEGKTKPFVELYLEFPLTATQVAKEAELKTCKTLARMAAKALALAEDALIFQGKSAAANLPGDVESECSTTMGDGLLGEAFPGYGKDDDIKKVSEPIEVPRAANAKHGIIWGEETFIAVAKGIAKLTQKAQAPNYALFLPIKAFADTFAPPGDQSLVTTAERIKPLVEGGFLGTGTLPEDKGLLVALGGDPTNIYVGNEARTEFVRKDGRKVIFKVVERVQFVVRDPRSLVLLNFKQ